MKLHRRFAGWLGYELIKKRKLNDTLEQHLSNVLSREKVNLIIDVGANVGQYARSLRLHGYAGKIESFEPLRDAYEELRSQSNLDPNWRSYRLALGSENRIATMRRYAASEFSSMLAVNAFARERFKWRTESGGSEDVQMTTLSDLWPEITKFVDDPRALLKLDTQGFDLEVLAGTGGALDDIVAIQAEISLKSIYQGAPRYLDALAEFERHGFEVTGMYAVSRDKKSLAIVEYDCVMTRQRDDRRAPFTSPP